MRARFQRMRKKTRKRGTGNAESISYGRHGGLFVGREYEPTVARGQAQGHVAALYVEQHRLMVSPRRLHRRTGPRWNPPLRGQLTESERENLFSEYLIQMKTAQLGDPYAFEVASTAKPVMQRLKAYARARREWVTGRVPQHQVSWQRKVSG